jgi:hypothetical protein
VPELADTIIRDLPRLRDTEAISRDMQGFYSLLRLISKKKHIRTRTMYKLDSPLLKTAPISYEVSHGSRLTRIMNLTFRVDYTCMIIKKFTPLPKSSQALHN